MRSITFVLSLQLLLVTTETSVVVAWSSPFSFQSPKISPTYIKTNQHYHQVRLASPRDDWKAVPHDLPLVQTQTDEVGWENDFTTQRDLLQQQRYQPDLEGFPPRTNAWEPMKTNGRIQRFGGSSVDDAPAVRISRTDAGTLEMHFPAEGASSKAVLAGAFSVAWFSALVPATASIAAVPFLAPFYLAGGVVVKRAVVDPFASLTVSLGRYAWSVHRTRYGRTTARELACGSTEDLSHAVVANKSRVDPETRQLHTRYELQLTFRSAEGRYGNSKPLTIGYPFSDSVEPLRLANTINQQLAIFQE